MRPVPQPSPREGSRLRRIRSASLVGAASLALVALPVGSAAALGLPPEGLPSTAGSALGTVTDTVVGAVTGTVGTGTSTGTPVDEPPAPPATTPPPVTPPPVTAPPPVVPTPTPTAEPTPEPTPSSTTPAPPPPRPSTTTPPSTPLPPASSTTSTPAAPAPGRPTTTGDVRPPAPGTSAPLPRTPTGSSSTSPPPRPSPPARAGEASIADRTVRATGVEALLASPGDGGGRGSGGGPDGVADGEGGGAASLLSASGELPTETWIPQDPVTGEVVVPAPSGPALAAASTDSSGTRAWLLPACVAAALTLGLVGMSSADRVRRWYRRRSLSSRGPVVTAVYARGR